MSSEEKTQETAENAGKKETAANKEQKKDKKKKKKNKDKSDKKETKGTKDSQDKQDSADKKDKKRRSGPRFTNSISMSLTTCLIFAVLSIMVVCFTISASALNSVKKDAIQRFYTNTFDAALQKRINSNERLVVLQADSKSKLLPISAVINSNQDLFKFRDEMNAMLSLENAVADLYIADEENKRSLIDNHTTMREYNSPPLAIIEKSILKDKNKTEVYKRTGNNKKVNIVEIPKYTEDKTPKLAYTVYVIPAQKNQYKDTLVSSLSSSFLIIALICALCISIIVRSIINPLTIMEKTVSNIAKGDLSGRLDYTKYDEINKLAKAYNMMANSLQRLYSSLEAQVNDQTRELKKAYTELQSTQAMMVHSEKMKSLGELVAGIMHEINNPINFIYGNMTHLGNYSKDLIDIIDEYSKYDSSLKPEEKTKVTNMKNNCDYSFLKTDMPDLIKSCKEGADRAKNIIQDLKSFSRMEEVSIKDVDIPAEIDTVLNILHNKIKNKAQVHKEYMENVPKVEAFGGQLNQVFMNILDNAAGAIEKTGDIWIRINSDKKYLIVEIEDNGSGMDDETIKKVFDPFFTTKPVGKGTGLGMSITYKIIKNHQGDIKVVSKKGQGAKFIVKLPLNIDREALKASVSAGDEKTNG